MRLYRLPYYEKCFIKFDFGLCPTLTKLAETLQLLHSIIGLALPPVDTCSVIRVNKHQVGLPKDKMHSAAGLGKLRCAQLIFTSTTASEGKVNPKPGTLKTLFRPEVECLKYYGFPCRTE